MEHPRSAWLRTCCRAALWSLVLTVLPAGAASAAGAPPDEPTLVSPGDGAVDVPAAAALAVNVTDPEGDAMNVAFFGRIAGSPAGESFTIVALPDTQRYAQHDSPTFRAQTQWIVDNREARNVVYVAHLGDCVQNGDNNGNDVEWVLADDAISLLEDPLTTMLPDGIPYGIAVGNHDQSPFGDPGTVANEGATTAFYNQFFGVPRFSSRLYYGGHFGSNNDNHYDLFSASGMDFIVIYMEYDEADGPLRQNVLAWADNLLGSFPDRRAIVVSHYIIRQGEQGSFGPQGQAIYDELKDHPNLFLMLAGHRPGEGKRLDTFNGSTVHSILADYQERPNDGDGWLRILEFSPVDDEIRVRTYSPTLDQYETDADSDFLLSYDMEASAPFVELGTDTGVPSGSNAVFTWTGRSAGTTYEWFATADDGTGQTAGPIWSFTSDGSCSLAPECDDGDPCTADDCVAGFCQNVADPGCCVEDPECDDGDPCSRDLCIDGSCQNPPDPCDDANPCTDDSCDPGSGCLNPEDDTNPCEDGLACTTGDRCFGGACVADDACPPGEFCEPATGACEISGGDALPLLEGEDWRYLKGTFAPPGDWRSRTFDDSGWAVGPSGFGYGDGDDATILDDMQDGYLTVYARHLFDVPNPGAVFGLTFTIDYDDAFVAYINDTEVARSSNITGPDPGYDQPADRNHEAGTPESFDLDPFVAQLVTGSNALAVQGHNVSLDSSDFSMIPQLQVTCDDGDPCTTDEWDPALGCVNSCDDGDPCTTGDGCDPFGACLGVPVEPPGEVLGVAVDGANPTSISWMDHGAGFRYDVSGGLLSALLSDGGIDAAECLRDDEPGTSYADTRANPGAGEGYYYVVRSQDDCASGTYGMSSGGERVPTGGCP